MNRSGGLAALALYAASLLARPVALGFPVVLFVLDTWLLGRRPRASLARMWPFAILAIAAAIVESVARAPGLNETPWLFRLQSAAIGAVRVSLAHRRARGPHAARCAAARSGGEHGSARGRSAGAVTVYGCCLVDASAMAGGVCRMGVVSGAPGSGRGAGAKWTAGHGGSLRLSSRRRDRDGRSWRAPSTRSAALRRDADSAAWAPSGNPHDPGHGRFADGRRGVCGERSTGAGAVGRLDRALDPRRRPGSQARCRALQPRRLRSRPPAAPTRRRLAIARCSRCSRRTTGEGQPRSPRGRAARRRGQRPRRAWRSGGRGRALPAGDRIVTRGARIRMPAGAWRWPILAAAQRPSRPCARRSQQGERDPAIANALGVLLLQSGQVREARVVFEAALATSPERCEPRAQPRTAARDRSRSRAGDAGVGAAAGERRCRGHGRSRSSSASTRWRQRWRPTAGSRKRAPPTREPQRWPGARRS